jgi:hypothetical protein
MTFVPLPSESGGILLGVRLPIGAMVIMFIDDENEDC